MAEQSGREVLRHTMCWCGAPMPEPHTTGRPRLSHDAACMRRRDALLQQLQRRQEYLAAWRAEVGHGNYPRRRIRAELKTLREELIALERTLAGEKDGPRC